MGTTGQSNTHQVSVFAEEEAGGNNGDSEIPENREPYYSQQIFSEK